MEYQVGDQIEMKKQHPCREQKMGDYSRGSGFQI